MPYLILIITLLSVGFGGGWVVKGWRCDATVARVNADAAKKVREIERRLRASQTMAREINEALRVEHSRELERLRADFEDIRNEVPTVVTADCVFSDDFVRVWNAATGRANRAGAGVPTEGEAGRGDAALPGGP